MEDQLEYNDFDELYDETMFKEYLDDDFLPQGGVREQFDSETQKLLNQF
tara:strand:- start:215 stop:361 length:147 start_codon:yes stop_codon:yes gene_type:complete